MIRFCAQCVFETIYPIQRHLTEPLPPSRGEILYLAGVRNIWSDNRLKSGEEIASSAKRADIDIMIKHGI